VGNLSQARFLSLSLPLSSLSRLLAVKKKKKQKEEEKKKKKKKNKRKKKIFSFK
jgi:hypothetical protein